MQASLAPIPAADGQLSLRSLRTLLGFLLFLALLLAGGLVALWSVDVPDAHFPRLPLLSGDGPAGPGHPWIEQLDPDQVVAGGAPAFLAIHGYNFTPGTKVFLNAAERQARLVNPHLLVAPMLSGDTNQSGGVTVTAMEGAWSANRRLAVIPAAKVRGVLKLGFGEVPIHQETRLVLLVLFAGALGSYLHAVRSLVYYIGNQTARESWFWFYITRPFVGMALALIFYAVIRGGFLAGTPVDAHGVNPFGVVAVAGLVGMFADKASQKLSEVFDTVFRTEDKRRDGRPQNQA